MLPPHKEYYNKYNVEFGMYFNKEISLPKIKFLNEENIIFDFNVYLPKYKTNLQRDYVWNDFQKGELIKSILIGRKLPKISLIKIHDKKGKFVKYEVIDGKQRLSAIFNFIKDVFPVELYGIHYFYNELPDDWKKQFQFYYLTADIAYYYEDEDNISDEDKINWFKLINFSGTPQDENHMDKFNI